MTILIPEPITQRPASPPSGVLSNPDLTKLYMSSSCPELKAESVISSDEEEALSDDNERLLFEPLESHDESAFSMDHNPPLCADIVSIEPPPATLIQPSSPPPSTTSSDSSTSSSSSSDISNRRKLQWKFKGLTLWLELEEFNNDLTRAVEDFSSKHSSPFIPKSHTTAIYGMEHLSVQEAKERLQQIPQRIGVWPSFAKPTGVTSDIAECGKPGQVCSIAWSELTLATNPQHEMALDELYKLFYDDVPSRDRPWKPHNSIAYDNPETNTLSLLDTVIYASRNPSLLGRGRRVEAISLWSTEGKMEEWVCIDRVKFW
ncbi:hypothetical protein ACHAXR_003991 [Thalassiosira sp. AJA248-18]